MNKNKFYNTQVKERFLNEEIKSESIKNSYEIIFRKTSKKEEEIGKDLYNFSSNELEDLFYLFNIKSKASFANRRSLIAKYINWCIDEGYSKSQINYLDTPLFKGGRGIQDKYLNRMAMKNKHITYEQLRNIEDFCVNYQDKLLFRLSFEGLTVDEMRNLHIINVDLNANKLTLINKNGKTRTITVSDECIRIIKNSYAEDIYHKNNGVVDPNIRISYTELENSGYVLRARKGERSGKVSIPLMNQRMNKILNLLGLSNLNYLTYTNLLYSGMIHYAQQMLNDKGNLTEQDYKDICVRFAKNPSAWRELKNQLKKF